MNAKTKQRKRKAYRLIPLYWVNAFTSRLFSGNPAAVCLPDKDLDDDQMQSIAAENNLSETAFLVPEDEELLIRWFTPITEVALCGHATLAAAFVLLENHKFLGGDMVRFQTRKSGALSVSKRDGLLEMDFPGSKLSALEQLPDGLENGLGLSPKHVFSAGEDIMAVFDCEQQVRDLRPDFSLLSRVQCRGVTATARGETSDFVSRFFAPRVGISEDPVTGSVHCALAPYWSNILGKKRLNAQQVSQRGGELFCEVQGDRVLIGGDAVLYLEGMVKLYSARDGKRW